MTPSSTPVTAPLEKVRIVRQGRHASEPVSSTAGFARSATGSVGLPQRVSVIRRRIAADREGLRRLRRTLPDLADVSQRFEIEEQMRILARGIEAGRQALERLGASGQARVWGPSDFVPGDEARFRATWCEVLHVGPAGLTVRLSQPSGGSGNAPAEYAQITGRRRAGREEADTA